MFDSKNLGSTSGYCYVIFHAWRDNGELGFSNLDSGAWVDNEFEFPAKGQSIESMPPSEYLNENFNYSGDVEECMLQVAEQANIQEGEDRYFEYRSDYKVTESRDYWGDYDSSSEMDNERWQEIDKESWIHHNG